ncbi:MAG TPA: hypothetical protein VH063_12940 [Gaiellaceae bacterium]|jgi:hypothetical protein|nr:hypothetical protein [Gaiellaceae bacterium]
MRAHTWRLLVAFRKSTEAQLLADELSRTTAVADAGGDLLYSAGFEDLVVFAPTPVAIEHIARLVQSAAAEAGVRPTRVSTALWLATDSRWTDEAELARSRELGRRAAKTGFEVSLKTVWRDP